MKKISLFILFFVGIMHSHAQKTVFRPTEFDDPANEFYNNVSSARKYESTNFVIYWGDKVGTNPATYSDANLRFNPQSVADTLEYIFKRYITDLHFINNAPTTNFGKYKIMIMMMNTWTSTDARLTGFAAASSFSNTIGAMFVHPAATRDGGALSHEFAHTLQMMMRIQENPGNGTAFAGYDWAGPFFEGHANYMRAMAYPQWADTDGTLTRWLQTRHFMWSSNRHHYTNYHLLFYVQEKEGFDFTRRMWAESKNQEHPLETIKRLKGFTQEQLNDYLWGYAQRQPAFDYPIQWNDQINTSSNFGKTIRSVYQSIKNNMPRYVSRQFTLLTKVSGSTDRYYTNTDWAPQDYGMNIIPLYPACTGTQKTVTVKFKGRTDVNAAQAGWRYGFVTTKADGTVSRYSPMNSSPEGEASFTLDATTESGIYLVVYSAPKVHINYNMDEGYPKQRRYPYELKIANAVPEGYQPAADFRSFLKTNGHLHSNGGGWVSNNASVAASVYVGPYAIVRGGTVSGNVRIEDFATVDGGNISGSAIVRGNAYVYNATLSSSAIAEGNAWMEGGSVGNTANVKGNAMLFAGNYTGTVVMGGDAEMGSCANGVYLQFPYWRNGRSECDGKGASDVSNQDINATFTNFTDAQMVFSVTPSCTGGTVNVSPTVSISAPLNNATYTAPASITINATAADVDGTISTVQFYNGTTLLGSDATSPYSFSWTNVAAGTYSLTAKATDNSGSVTTSSVVSVVVNPAANTAPTVSISAPLNNATYTAPASITINATAADTDGTISTVQFYNGTTLLGSDATSPYSFSWTNVAAGTYSLTAKATDNSGGVTTSSVVSVVVNPAANTAPTVSISAPLNNATYTAPASITINATATDADGTISTVQFYNGTTLLGSDATSPYSFSWTNVAAGTYSLTAKATDNSGGVTTSSVVSVVVSPAANTAPTVSINAPLNNATYTAPASITINATATDADGTISTVQFYNGTTLLGSDATSPYSFSWTNVAAGTYSLTAKATDNSGAVTTSSVVLVVVNANTSTADIIGVDCGSSNSTITFELNSTKRTNATSYNWWYTGSVQGTSVSPSTPYLVAMQTGLNFSAGQVCVGVNYSVSPWYTSYCKSISKCASSKIGEGENNESLTKTSIAFPNPSCTDFNFITKENVLKIEVVNEIGEIVFSKEKLEEGIDVLFGNNFSAGVYLINVLYLNGGYESQRLVKLK